MLPVDLIHKYRLTEAEATDVVEYAITGVLTKAFRTQVLVYINGQLDVFAFRRGEQDEPLVRIEPKNLSSQLQRHIRYSIERELEKRQVLAESERLKTLRGNVVQGEVSRVMEDGSLSVAVEVDDVLERVLLNAECPVKNQPPHERASCRVGDVRWFYVSSVLPVSCKGKARVRIMLNRVSKLFPVILLSRLSGEPDIKCEKRIAGAYCNLTVGKRVPRESIVTVARELGERINVVLRKK